MTSLNPRADIYGPKTLSVMDHASAAVWRMLRADDPFRDSYNDSELRMAIGHKLMDRMERSSSASKLTGEGLVLELKRSGNRFSNSGGDHATRR